MTELVSYGVDEGVATITMDDGKVNVLSLPMLTALGDALDRAQAEEAVVVLAGREGMFSAGFDLATLRGGGTDATDMLRAGFDLAHRLLSFPAPVVVACTGHAVAMGVFVLLSADYRIGTLGSFRITANEVAIGLPMPNSAIEICRQRLTPAHFHRTVVLAEVFPPETAVDAGFLDRARSRGRPRRRGPRHRRRTRRARSARARVEQAALTSRRVGGVRAPRSTPSSRRAGRAEARRGGRAPAQAASTSSKSLLRSTSETGRPTSGARRSPRLGSTYTGIVRRPDAVTSVTRSVAGHLARLGGSVSDW